MIGKLLCLLGLHDPLITQPSIPYQEWYEDGLVKEQKWYFDYTRWTSAIGFCSRCNKIYQWN